jgi:microsomal dipeptidase-like Zn-dependent dipeptidase
VTAGLVKRGYDESQVQAILGGNYLRLLASAWNTKP